MNAMARYLVTGLLGLLAGVFLTLIVSGRHDAAETVDAANEVVAQTASDNVKAAEDNVAIVKEVDAKNTNADAVKETVLKQLKPEKEVRYVTVTIPGVAAPQMCPPVTGDTPMPLSVHSVRLLNDLRAAKTVDLTALSPDEIKATTEVNIASFVSADVDTVKLYNELAVIHDELVDRVLEYMKYQAAEK